MKPVRSTFFRIIASALLIFCAFASASFAATNPLNNPRGMAVDAKGNLWVANVEGGASGTGNVLAFSPGYVLQKADTITSNLNLPTAVAFDPLGNLWVANAGTSNGSTYGSIAEYVAGKQNTSATITNGVVEPLALAIDGMGDVRVENQLANITVYASTSVYAPPTSLLQTLTVNPPVYGIAVANNVLGYGNANGTILVATEPILASNAQNGGAYGFSGVALAGDNKGDFYIGNSDGSVVIATPAGEAFNFLQLSFAPTGIAVDNVRGRVYISNGPANTIYAYSTAGALLKTIQ